MLPWNQLHQQLETVANRHLELASRFEEFARYVEEQVTPQAFHIKGISVSLHLDKGFFVTTFGGRTLHFVLSTGTGEGAVLIAKVNCYLEKEYPERTFLGIGEFTFNRKGETNLLEPESNDQITIDCDDAALYIALHFIHESLSK